MRAETHDQLRVPRDSDKFPVGKLLLAVAVLVGLLLFWFWSGQDEPAETVSVAPPAPVAKTVVEPAPDIRRRPEPLPEVVPAPETQPQSQSVAPASLPMPSKAESDKLLREQLAAAGADARVNSFIGSEHPLEVSAALLDGLSRGVLLRKILPAGPPKEAFSAPQRGELFYMGDSSYERYDSYTNSIASLDSTVLVDSFHLLRPIYERAYKQLGLDSEDFDNAVIRTLDIILATPEIEEPIALKRDSVMYTYADTTLENLPSVQKQLLRMGPDNIRRLKAQARALKNGLLEK